MIQKFKQAGYEIVDFSEKADIYIINTCTVTNMSDRKSRQILSRAKELNKSSTVVAVGCYVQVAKDEIQRICWIREYDCSKRWNSESSTNWFSTWN